MSVAQPESPRPVLVDTDVFSRAYLPGQRLRDQDWVSLLFGRTIAVAVQTAVELRSGARMAHWGERRLAELEALIGGVQVVPITDRVQAAYVDLTVWARANSHAVQDKIHVGDRWIAATALAWDLELASADGLFVGVVGLRRLTI